MGKFLDADIAHCGMFTPEEIDVLNFVAKTATERLALISQDDVEQVASSAIFLYSTGMDDPDLLLHEVLSRFGKPIKPPSAVTATTIKNGRETPLGISRQGSNLQDIAE